MWKWSMCLSCAWIQTIKCVYEWNNSIISLWNRNTYAKKIIITTKWWNSKIYSISVLEMFHIIYYLLLTTLNMFRIFLLLNLTKISDILYGCQKESKCYIWEYNYYIWYPNKGFLPIRFNPLSLFSNSFVKEIIVLY